MRQAILLSILGAFLSTTALAQDAGMGTPVITPPILDQSGAASQQLLVPPNEANPAPLAAPTEAPAAQPAAPATAAPAAGAAPTPAASAPPPAAATPAPAADQPPNRTTSAETFTDWTLECFEPAFDDGACQIVHRVTSGNADQVVVVFALSAAAADGDAAIQIALPLGISLPAGVRLTIGDGYQNQIALDRCTPQGCIVEGVGSSELMAAMKRGANGALVVENEQGQPIQLPFSLSGFTAAFDAMIERNAG